MTPHKRFDPDSHYAIEETDPDADTSHVKRNYLDIPYAELSPSQRLDVYPPDKGNGPFPVIVSFHGGAFVAGDKADLQVPPLLKGLKRSSHRIDRAKCLVYTCSIKVSSWGGHIAIDKA